MDNEEAVFHMAFSHCYGIGPIRFFSLIKQFGSAKNAYHAPQAALRKVLSPVCVNNFLDFRTVFNIEKKMEELNRKCISVFAGNDSRFPNVLRHIPDPPICLYVKGNIGSIDFNRELFFGVVGTRKPSSYGQYIAHLFSSGLAKSGFILVSGLAMGIDAIAHKTALEEKTKTIAILGCGVDIVYPSCNRGLYYDIIQKGGLIMSEFPPGHTVLPGLFIARNRLISGLSKGLLVVEGTKDSGTLTTARYAAEQGRTVFAPPVPLNSQLSEAPNILIHQGAVFVSELQDILDELGITSRSIRNKPFPEHLTTEEKRVVDLISNEPLSADEIGEQLSIQITEVLACLSLLEFKSVIVKNNEGKYQLY